MGRFTDRLFQRRAAPNKRQRDENVQIWRCGVCRQADTYPVGDIQPTHCHTPMTAGDVIQRGDPDMPQVNIVQVWPRTPQPTGFYVGEVDPPPVLWAVPEQPLTIFEVWHWEAGEGEGRYNGERIGWMAERESGWEYKMVPGVAASRASGFLSDRNAAVFRMLELIQEG